MTAIELRHEGTLQTARLFETHASRVLAYCLRRLGSRSEAEDAAQTTFLYAHRALGRGVVPQSEEAWLLAIAKNVCRWQQRTASRRGTSAREVDLDTLPARGNDDDLEEVHRDLRDALASVPERQRQALLLREWRGLSCPEIAEVLEMSPPATHALLTRARRSVASALAAAGRRPVLGLDLPSLLSQLRALLAGGAGKVVATAVAVAGLGIGGVAVERAVATEAHAPRTGLQAPRASGPASALVTRPRANDALASSPHRRGALATRGTRPGSRAAPPRGSNPASPGATRDGPGSTSPGVDALPASPSEAGPSAMQPELAVVPLPRTDDPGSIVDLLPPLPVPTTPTVSVPTVPVPTVPVPTVDVPSVEVPGVDVPGVDVPTVDLPTVAAPTVPSTDPVTGLVP